MTTRIALLATLLSAPDSPGADYGSPVPPLTSAKAPPRHADGGWGDTVPTLPTPKKPAVGVLSYADGCKFAFLRGRPLLTWVGLPVPATVPDGYLIARADALPGMPDRCLIVSAWVGADHRGLILDPADAGRPASLAAAVARIAPPPQATQPSPGDCPPGLP